MESPSSLILSTTPLYVLTRDFIIKNYTKNLSIDEFENKGDLIISNTNTIECIASDAFDDFINLTILRINGNNLKTLEV